MFEYKVVPAPQRAVKVKGLRTTADRFAHALAERINAEAAGGWEFLRTETLTCEERSGLGRVRTSTQTVMVFARALGQARPDAGAALAALQAGRADDRALPAEDPVQTEAPQAPIVDWSNDPAPAWHRDPHPPEPAAPAWDHGPAAAAEPLAAQSPGREGPQLGSLRRQEPLFRSGARLHDDRAVRAEPMVRAPRADRTADDA